MRKFTINGHFSIAMLVYQRVILYIVDWGTGRIFIPGTIVNNHHFGENNPHGQATAIMHSGLTSMLQPQ